MSYHPYRNAFLLSLPVINNNALSSDDKGSVFAFNTQIKHLLVGKSVLEMLLYFSREQRNVDYCGLDPSTFTRNIELSKCVYKYVTH